jgi:hypothetical protein
MSLIEQMRLVAKRGYTVRGAPDAAYLLEQAAAELEANAAEIGRKGAALKEARIVLMAHGFGAHSVTIAQIDAALNKQESGNV